MIASLPRARAFKRCPHCGRAGVATGAWEQMRAALAFAEAPMSLRELMLATGLREQNLSSAIGNHRAALVRTGERGSYRYALRATS